jgi:hypothetical protein
MNWFVVERDAEALEMAGKGKDFDFHGCFRDKADAVAKEKEVGGFIRERTVLGRRCYLVLTAKKK